MSIDNTHFSQNGSRGVHGKYANFVATKASMSGEIAVKSSNGKSKAAIFRCVRALSEFLCSVLALASPIMAYAVTDIADLCPSKASETEKKIVNCTQAIESKKYSGAGLAGLLRNRGIVFAEELQEYGHAIADYSVALHLDSSGSDTYFNRALAYAAHGETEKTIADYRESIKLSPKVTDAYYDRGGIYFATNNYPSAIADYSAAILIDPKNSKALSGRGLRMPLQRSMAKLSRTSMRPFVLILKARKRITVAASCFTGKRNMTRIYLIVTPR